MNIDKNSTESLLISTDWNAEWMRLQEKRRKADDVAWWDRRAKHFRPRETSPYAQAFLARAGVRPGESVLDMGCGSGTLAVPLAQSGCQVIAADFSPRMLEELVGAARALGVTVASGGFSAADAHRRERQSAAAPMPRASYAEDGPSADGACGTGAEAPEAQSPDGQLRGCLHPVRLAWADDWHAAGVGDKSVDVAVASRSIATSDLKAALLKLDGAARRRCCITLACNAGPRYDADVLAAVGVSVGESVDYLYAFNILAQLGRAPEVTYLDSPRKDTFDSLEDGVADFARMLESGHEDKVPALRSYLAAHMVENPEAGEPGPKGRLQGRYTLDHQRLVRWAFISWEPQA